MAITDHQKEVLRVVSQSCIYIDSENNQEGIRIYTHDTLPNEDTNEMYFYGTGEESGEEYAVNFDDVNLKTSLFYGLVLVNTND